MARHDVQGRKQPRRIGVLTLMRAIPGLRAQFSAIPPEFWGDDVEASGDDAYTCAVVSCPCGQTPRVEIGQMDTCACGRIFYYAGADVFVANSPKQRPVPPTA